MNTSVEVPELNPAIIAKYSKTPLLVPAGLHTLLLKYKPLEKIACLDEVLDAMKNYISSRILYDLRNPRIINCQDDELGTELGTTNFSLTEIKKIVMKKLLSANKEVLLAIFPSVSDSVKRKGVPDADGLSEAERAKRSCSQSVIQRPSSPLNLMIPPPGVYDSSSDTALSMQGYETAFVRDSSDEDTSCLDELDNDTNNFDDIITVQQTYEVEYEVESDISDGRSVSDSDSELSDAHLEALKVALHSVFCKNIEADDITTYKTDSDKGFWADSSSDDDSEVSSDAEIPDSDKWKCTKCGGHNRPLMRFCTKCWSLRAGWLPDRHERRQKPRRRTRATKQDGKPVKNHTGESAKLHTGENLIVCDDSLLKDLDSTPSSSLERCDSGVSSVSSQPVVYDDSLLKDLDSPPGSSLERCDSGISSISSQELLPLPPSQSAGEPVTSQNSAVSQISVATDLYKEPCSLCLMKPKNATIVHGNLGHQFCCYRCARKLLSKNKPCPLCRRSIDRVIHQIFV